MTTLRMSALFVVFVLATVFSTGGQSHAQGGGYTYPFSWETYKSKDGKTDLKYPKWALHSTGSAIVLDQAKGRLSLPGGTFKGPGGQENTQYYCKTIAMKVYERANSGGFPEEATATYKGTVGGLTKTGMNNIYTGNLFVDDLNPKQLLRPGAAVKIRIIAEVESPAGVQTSEVFSEIVQSIGASPE